MWIVSPVAGVYKPYGGTTTACMWQKNLLSGRHRLPQWHGFAQADTWSHAGGFKKLREAADPGAPPGLFFSEHDFPEKKLFSEASEHDFSEKKIFSEVSEHDFSEIFFSGK